MEAKLCLFPVLGGCRRICFPKFNSADQEDSSLGLAVILSNVLDSRFPQAGRADFGMCFIVGPLSRGWAKFGIAVPSETLSCGLVVDESTAVAAGDEDETAADETAADETEADTGAEAGSDCDA
jgi:hypothetical protein